MQRRRSSKRAKPMEEDTWWDDEDHQEAGVIAVLTLTEDTKHQLELLFFLLDRDGSGRLTQNDFEVVPPPSGTKSAAQAAQDALFQREILVRWHELRKNFDFANDQAISPGEFVHGMKVMALKHPLDEGSRLRPEARSDASHLEYLTLLTASLNNTIKNLCKHLFE